MHDPLKYLQAYPASLQDQVRQLIAENRLGEYLERRYPGRHDVQSDKALYAYTMNLKQEHLRNAPAWTRCSTTTSSTWSSVLGLHTAISRVQGGKLKAKKEIRVASCSRTPPRSSCG